MDFKLTPVAMPTSVRPNLGVRSTSISLGEEKNGGFSHVLKGALSSVSAAQNESSRLQREVQMENPQVSLEETMVSIQKAQIGFQTALHVRNRMVQAYTDIMNMQV